MMSRETLDPNSAHVVLDVRPTGDIEFMTRPAAGSPSRRRPSRWGASGVEIEATARVGNR
jgi:hypothetical protein